MVNDKQVLVYSIIGIGTIVLIGKLIKRMSNKQTKLSNNFNWSEFQSKDGATMPAEAKANVEKLVKNLELIRAAAGNKPIKIHSGYRSPQHNAEVGGKSKSYHMLGMAADFDIKGMKTKEVYNLVQSLISKGIIPQGGLGLYPSWVHYDIRGFKARW